MGTEATKYFRFRCIPCKECEDFETIELARGAGSEHNTIMHGGSKKSEIGKFFSMDPKPYWGFPA